MGRELEPGKSQFPSSAARRDEFRSRANGPTDRKIEFRSRVWDDEWRAVAAIWLDERTNCCELGIC